jgi:hypothetical protein
MPDDSYETKLSQVDEFLAWAMLRSVRLCRYERDGDSLLGHYAPLNNRETQQLAECYLFSKQPAAPREGTGE